MPANLTTKLGQLVDVLTPDTTGKIGINMVPSNVLDITQTANSASYARIQNASAGSSATVGWQITNNTSSSYAAVFGGSFTPSGMARADGLILQSGGAGGLSFNTVGAVPIYFGINSVEKMRLDASGNLGIGMTPTNVLDITQSTASGATVKILNSNAGAGAYCSFDANNGTSLGQIVQYGASYTTSGVSRQNGTLVYGNGAGGLTISTGLAQPIYFGINLVEKMRLSTVGSLGIGCTVGAVASNSTNFPAVQVGAATVLMGRVSGSVESYWTNDIYYDGTNYRYINGGAGQGATFLYQNGEAVIFYRAPSGGSAGGVATPTIQLNIASNGAVTNTTGSYGTISDLKVKQDIVLASSQWEDVKAISKIISKYSLKTDPETRLLGVVAQDLWKISPGLVRSSADKTPDGKDLGTTTLSVDLSTMYMKAVKALGEALERIETLETRLAALETK